MDERTAVAITAVRAIETTDRAHAAWTDVDRAWASRAAAEVVGAAASPAAFVSRRAMLALDRLRSRKDGLARFVHAWRWRPWVGSAFVLIAFAVGMGADALGGLHRINILYSPVAPLVLWNVIVYLVIVGGFVVRYGESGTPGPLARFVVWLAGGMRSPRRTRDDLALQAKTAFVVDWTGRATALYAARAARILHLASAALALGIIAGMYVRGVGLEYRATWESTFLDPSGVRTLVAAFCAPGVLVTGIPVPDAAHIAAIRAPVSENAALWLHLMAATLAVVVIAPRFLLAAVMGAFERYRARHLIADFSDPYYQRMLRGFTQSKVAVDAVPYSFAVSAEAASALEALLARGLGGNVTMQLRPSVAYGDEDALPELAGAPSAPIAALFNAAATPEREAHGRFVAALAGTGRPLLVVVDEASWLARWGSDMQRREERRALWRAFAAGAGCAPVFVDLAHPDFEAAEASLEAAMESLAA